MSQRPFALHTQDAWMEKVGNPRLPLWLRIACLAYGSHRANGHAPLSLGDIGLALATIDTATGECWEPSRQNINRGILVAVDYGFIDPTSGARCLVVPERMVRGGLGDPLDVCPAKHRTPGARPRSARPQPPLRLVKAVGS